MSKNWCIILMAQAYESIDFDNLFVSLSTFNLWAGFAFCQVELRYRWHALAAILLSNEYILLTCYYTIYEACSRKDLCHEISQINDIRIPLFERKTKIDKKLTLRAPSPSCCFSAFIRKHNTTHTQSQK